MSLYIGLGRGARKKIGVLLFTLIVFAIGWFGFCQYLIKVNKPIGHADTKRSSVQTITPVSVQSRIAVFGNSFWGRYTNDWSMASPLKTAYPFSRLKEFHRNQYDAWITGLECPTKSAVHMTSAETEAALQFNCDPAYLPEAAKWFTAFSLANNHTDNQGIDGFLETKQNLDSNHIQYFGHYDPYKIDEVCEVLSIPARVTMSTGSIEKGKLPMAFCGYHGVFKIPPQQSLAVMERYSKVIPVFALPHMGIEYQPAPDALKVSTYHRMIDYGADAVLGDHPHWIQNTEAYKGHLIVYSMGNFMFDQQGSVELVRSAGIRMNVSVGKIDQSELQSWLKVGANCEVYHDTCLEQIEKQKLGKLPITIEFGVIGTKDDGKITHPATDSETKGIWKRLDWASTMTKLHFPYSSL